MDKALEIQAVVENVAFYAAAFLGGHVVLAVIILLGVVFMEPFGLWGFIAPVAYTFYLCGIQHKNEKLKKLYEQEEPG